MKYKVNETVSAEGKVYVEGEVYDSNELPVQFLDEWLESGNVEEVKKAKPKADKKEKE